ncbi:cation diffusion facilitator family transporter [Rhabdobacter roseus]|uniref:Cobalt-zinc-cadmium efflux system protein n=1 Tax=Rhabdobacter roseus TaxID=1655419 RepID=A0A840TM15_9BACT|nr:cation diffusion facilitator family transporter [Rhabdobacter roseus]MBB5285276.1 cobalt-zinc-cadmium efflux system protein [Rhabdobacter roseus]
MVPHQEDRPSASGVSVAFWLNLLFSIIEVYGGLLTNSTAILADAFHDFMDTAAIGLAVLLDKISNKKRTLRFSYGYKRFSLLAALGLSVFLLIGAVLMAVSGVKSWLNPEVVDSLGMLWLAVLGIGINGFAFLRIKNGNGSHHTHGHSHNHNHQAIMLHLLEDVLGWVAVLVGAGVIYYTGWYWIDGVLTLAIATFIGYNATKNLTSVLKVLLQSVPENVNLEQLSAELTTLEGVENIHDLHVWSLDGNYHVGSLHAVIGTSHQHSENSIYASIRQVMEKHHIQHPTVQLETTDISCQWVSC